MNSHIEVNHLEESTLDFLLSQFSIVLNDYHELAVLKQDLYDYALFMADVYAQPTYFSDYYQIKTKWLIYLESRQFTVYNFSQFQRHFIIRCLFEGMDYEELDLFVTKGIGDEDMVKSYQRYFGK